MIRQLIKQEKIYIGAQIITSLLVQKFSESKTKPDISTAREDAQRRQVDKDHGTKHDATREIKYICVNKQRPSFTHFKMYQRWLKWETVLNFQASRIVP